MKGVSFWLLLAVLGLFWGCEPDTYAPIDSCEGYIPISADFVATEVVNDQSYPLRWIPNASDTFSFDIRLTANYASDFPERYDWTVNGAKSTGRTIRLFGKIGVPVTYTVKLVIRRPALCGDDGVDSVTKTYTIFSSHTRITGTFVGKRNDGLDQTIVIDTSRNDRIWPVKYPTINGLEDTFNFRLNTSVIRGLRQWIVNAGIFRWNGQPPNPNCGRANARLQLFGQDSLKIDYSLATEDNQTIYTFLGREGRLTPLTPTHPK